MSLVSQVVGNSAHHVVFLHGLFGQGKNWTSIANSLADVATCHLVDLPNHGLSPWTLDFDLDGQAELIADWLAAELDSPTAVVGHSLGGKIAMRLAIHHPELVSRLMVVDISPARNEAALSFAHLVAALRSIDIDNLSSRSQAEQELTQAIPDSGVRKFLLQNLRRSGDSWFWAANLDLLGDSLHAIGGWAPLTGSFDGPVLWVNGGKSSYVKEEHLEPMRALFPKVLQMTLKRAGHWVHADDPEGFVTICRYFLTQL